MEFTVQCNGDEREVKKICKCAKKGWVKMRVCVCVVFKTKMDFDFGRVR